MTFREFNNALVGVRRIQEAEFREQWERVRVIYVSNIAPYLDKKTPMDVTKIYPFPWDGLKGERYELKDPVKEHEKALKRWRERDQNQNN